MFVFLYYKTYDILSKYVTNCVFRFFFSSDSKIFSPDKVEFNADQTLTELRNISIVCPAINEELLNVYFSYFQKIGYFPEVLNDNKI